MSTAREHFTLAVKLPFIPLIYSPTSVISPLLVDQIRRENTKFILTKISSTISTQWHKKGTIRRQAASFGSSTDSQQPEPPCVRTIQGHNRTFTPSWHNHRITHALVTSGFWTSGGCLTCRHIISRSSGQLCDEITKCGAGDKACDSSRGKQQLRDLHFALSKHSKHRTPQPT